MTEKQPPSYPLRMPQELREQLSEVAKANNRSMNAEIVARLQNSFATPNLSGKTRSFTESGELVEKDIVQKIADLQELIAKANFAASTLSLFEGVQEERDRREREKGNAT